MYEFLTELDIYTKFRCAITNNKYLSIALQDDSFTELHIDKQYTQEILLIYYPEHPFEFGNEDEIQILNILQQVKNARISL